MIAQAVTRRYTRLRDEGQPFPDLIILDGGITQLRAAREALATIGVAGIPTVGLAKRFEELVTDDGRPPLFLPRDSDGLMVVTRLRDEAHRFAITYHRDLRGKASVHSALEDIPGIGPARRRALLQYFKSVKAIREADLEELQKVSGMNAKAAQAVFAWAHPEQGNRI